MTRLTLFWALDMQRFVFPLILGLGGIAILVSLGVWQLQRLEWKEAILAEIDSRISAEPVAIPADPDPDADRYMPVLLDGTLTGARLFVLTSIKDTGPGFRVIEAVETAEGRVLLDRGFVRQGEEGGLTEGPIAIRGNLHWPEEVDNWTPEPDGQLWFARDVTPMAETLDAAPFLVVAAEVRPEDEGVLTPQPIDSRGISNDHLNYAITWFLLAIVWAAMTGYLLWRARKAG